VSPCQWVVAVSMSLDMARPPLTFGEHLQLLRKRLRLSQAVVARHVGVSRQSVSMWETDAARPTVDMIPALAEILQVTPNELLGWHDKGITMERPAGPSDNKGPDVNARISVNLAL